MRRVLVTRPEPGSAATAAILRERGFEPVVLPLSQTVPLHATGPLPECDAVAVTSANALRHASPELVRHFLGKTCFAVGAKTAAAARKAGFAHVEAAEGGAQSLAARIASRYGARGKIAYLAGRVRLPDFEQALEQADVAVIAIETYDTQALEPSAHDLRALGMGRPIDAVLIYSAKAADAVQRLATRPELAETFSHAVHCCLSGRVAARLMGVDSSRIRVAVRPEEAAILALLEG